MTQDIEERPRGFLTQTDREFLVTPEEDLDVQNQTKWKRRRNIRERVYNAILDFKFLEEMEHQDVEQVFDEIQDNWMDDAKAIRSMFQFVYLGLLESGLADGLPPLIEHAVWGAQSVYNQTHGEYLRVDPNVEISIEHRLDPDEDEMADYDTSIFEELYLEQFQEPESGLDTAEHARRQYQAMATAGVLDVDDREPDSEREEEAVELLREFCEKNEIESLGELHQFVEEASEDHSIHTLLETMKTVTTPIEHTRTDAEEKLDEMLFSPSNYEEYKQKFRPRGVEDWDPSSDPALEELIAFKEATEAPMTEEEYWDRLKEEVGFDPDDWDYEAIREDPEQALWG